ncbi:MAG: hypothetical protein ACI8X5_003600 [Planctomycetota bacterium]|jgi:hypothetical protein
MPLIASGGGTQNGPELMNASSTTLVVTSDGATLASEIQSVPTSASTTQELTSGGPLWTHPDGGLAWIGQSVALGNCGNEVFAEYALNNETAELFSVYDARARHPSRSFGSRVVERSENAGAVKAVVGDVCGRRPASGWIWGLWGRRLGAGETAGSGSAGCRKGDAGVGGGPLDLLSFGNTFRAIERPRLDDWNLIARSLGGRTRSPEWWPVDA